MHMNKQDKTRKTKKERKKEKRKETENNNNIKAMFVCFGYISASNLILIIVLVKLSSHVLLQNA